MLVGPGNNGSDGLVAAEELRHAHRQVHIYTYRREVGEAFDGIVTRSEDDGDRSELRRLIERAGLVIDALLGTGKSRPMSEDLASIVAEVNRAHGVRVLAVDVPTGVNADTGAVREQAIRADLTLCMGFAKLGLYQYPGAAHSGVVEVADIGLLDEPAEQVRTVLADAVTVASLLPERDPNGSKGSSGSALFVGGSRDLCGAPAMASMAAYRSGAGLLRIAVSRAVQPIVAGHATEPVFLILAEKDGRIAAAAYDDIAQALRKAKALIFGPGMGLSEETIELTRRTLESLQSVRVPSVIDADGLNALSKIESWWEASRSCSHHPAPG